MKILSNLPLIIAIVLIIIIIALIIVNKNKKHEQFVAPETSPPAPVSISDELLNALRDNVALCFTPDQEPGDLSPYITADEMIDDSPFEEQFVAQLYGIFLYGIVNLKSDPTTNNPYGLIGFVKEKIQILLDGLCTIGAGSMDVFNRSMLKVVKSFLKIQNNLIKIKTGVEPVIDVDDNYILQQLSCLRKSYLPLNDPNLLLDFDPYNFESLDMDVIIALGPIGMYSIGILSLIGNIGNNVVDNGYCIDVNLDQPENIISDIIGLDGVEKKCNNTTYNPPVQPVYTTSPVQPVYSTSPAQPVDTGRLAQPVDTGRLAQPVDTTSPAQPVYTTRPAQPVDTAPFVQPVYTTRPAQPVDTTRPVQQVDTTYTFDPTHTFDPTALMHTLPFSLFDSPFISSPSQFQPVQSNGDITLVNSRGPNNFFLPKIKITA